MKKWLYDTWNKVGYKYLTMFLTGLVVFCLVIGELRGVIGLVIFYAFLWLLAYLMRNNP
jgi:hypothetical protein